MAVKLVIQGLLDLLYPPTCEICGKKAAEENNIICENCFEKIIMITPVIPVKHNDISVWGICAYEGVIKECIHLFKYKARLRLLKPLGKIMTDFTNNYLKSKKFDIIVPVPLHRARLAERSFNQAELLAKNLPKYLNCRLDTKILKRTKNTATQTGLSKTQRANNLRGVFKMNTALAVEDKNILIVDDVFTTGSTIDECAKILLKANAKSVEALVLAKGI